MKIGKTLNLTHGGIDMEKSRVLAVKILNKLIETNRLKKPGCEWGTTIGMVSFILEQELNQKKETK